MDVLNLFSSVKKNEEKLERDKLEREKREEQYDNKIIERDRIERERIKIIQPLDIDKMKEFKKRTIRFITQCKKKEYIYDYFQRMSSNVFFIKNNSRPCLIELRQIIIESIPKDEERQLRLLMNNLEYDHIRNKDILIMTHSIFIIDTLYDYCKSVDTEIENSKL